MPMTSVSSIKSVSGSFAVPIVVAVVANDDVQLWDIENSLRLDQVATFSKTPGVMASLSSDGKMFFAGSYYAGGGMGYSISERREVWRRKDLRRFSSLTSHPFEPSIFCSFDRKPSLQLDSHTGATLNRLHGVKEVYASPFEPLLIFGSRDLRIGKSLERANIRIPRTTFAVLDIAFARNLVAVSESGGLVRCFDLSSGKEVWRYEPTQGVHVLHVSFCPKVNVFVGVDWAYTKKKGDCRLLHFDADTGRCKVLTRLESALDFAFCLEGLRLVNSEGAVIDTSTGKLVRKLAFAREEYEEPRFPSWDERIRSGTPAQRELARLLGPPE